MKSDQLDQYRVDRTGDRFLSTNFGTRVDDTDNSLRAGSRGPTLLEDFHAREKITHFDHERIPERVVHARGAGAYGYFQPYESLAEYTRAAFLQDPAERTPVFVRFSTVAGSRGSADTVRDVRGFAVKFYTREGNYDLVGNNMPVFFIQDAIKFPDFVHAVKPEPHNEIPQAQSAHDTFWDFVALQPEAMHTVMWLMSDRALPRSYRMMQGFGVHTFRFVNADGLSTFVKFHWRPVLGTHSLVWDETSKIAGADPDFNRRDLWEAIESGQFPEWELGVQLVPEQDEHAFDFDLLDATKIIPEEIVPVRPVGRLVLDRNPENFFAETEQVAFHTAHVVPGIDFTNDPLLQGRNFSYLDTQLSRLGGPNFEQLPVNQPLAPVRNNQRDGMHQTRIEPGPTSYHKASLGYGCPVLADTADGAYSHHQEHIEGHAMRVRAASFADHYSQATLFWNSMSDWERDHIVAAFRFELGHVETPTVRERMVAHLNRVDHALARLVAEGIGVDPPDTAAVDNHGRTSPALSQANVAKNGATGIATRQVAILAGDGVSGPDVDAIEGRLRSAGAVVHVLAAHPGPLATTDGPSVTATHALATRRSVLYDAVFVPGGSHVPNLIEDGAVRLFIAEAFKHGKAVAAVAEGAELLVGLPEVALADRDATVVSESGVVTGSERDTVADAFVDAIAAHRHHDRAVDMVAA